VTFVEHFSFMISTIGLYNCGRFVWSYHRKAGPKAKEERRWWKTPHGRYMMGSAAIMGSFFFLIVWAQLFPRFPGMGVVALILYVGYVAFTGMLNKILDISLPDAVESAEIGTNVLEEQQ